MVKKSVFLMSVIVAGLVSGSMVEAVKYTDDFKGPMDLFVKRTPRSSTARPSPVSQQDSRSGLQSGLKKRRQTISKPNLTPEQVYLLARAGVNAGLTSMQKGWLNK